MRTSPAGSLRNSATLSKAACAPSTVATHRLKKRCPASVSARARVVRCSRRTPRRFSSAATRRLSRVFSTPIVRAAAGKGFDAYVAVDASGTFSETKRQVGLLRMLQAGVIVSDYATLMVEILKDNARPEAGEVYGAMDMDWAKLVGQIAQAYRK